MSVKHVGIVSILFASLMWSVEPVFAKLSYQNSDFLHTSMVRAVFVTLVALIYVMITNKADFRISRKQFPPLLYVAIVGTVFADLMYFFALTQVPVVNAVVIGHLQPVFIVLMGYILLRGDRLNRFDYLGVLFMILSGLLVSTKTVENFANLKFGSMGDLFVLFATVAWATTTIAARKYLRELNAGVITFYRFLVASVFFTFYLVFFSYVSVSSVYQVLVGVVVGVGTILYYEGLKRIKAAQVSAVELSTPFFAAILGFVVLGEGVTLLQIVGMFLLFVGIYYLSKKE